MVRQAHRPLVKRDIHRKFDAPSKAWYFILRKNRTLSGFLRVFAKEIKMVASIIENTSRVNRYRAAVYSPNPPSIERLLLSDPTVIDLGGQATNDVWFIAKPLKADTVRSRKIELVENGLAIGEFAEDVGNTKKRLIGVYDPHIKRHRDTLDEIENRLCPKLTRAASL